MEQDQMSNIRFGILAWGGFPPLCQGLASMQGVELTAVAARNADRSAEFARTYGARKSYDNYQDLITDDSVDAVYIGLLNNRHFEFTQLAWSTTSQCCARNP